MPDDFIDAKSGVICCPNNFKYNKASKDDKIIRITCLANFDRWNKVEGSEYEDNKKRATQEILNKVVEQIPDFRDSILFSDIFTPKTLYDFTGHINGAVYGTPHKIRTGKTHIDCLYICGTDQGFLGIIGALLSGISIANLYLLK